MNAQQAKELHLRDEAERREPHNLKRKAQSAEKLAEWANKNGWDGVSNSKLLEVFIPSLVDELKEASEDYKRLGSKAMWMYHEGQCKMKAIQDQLDQCRISHNDPNMPKLLEMIRLLAEEDLDAMADGGAE